MENDSGRSDGGAPSPPRGGGRRGVLRARLRSFADRQHGRLARSTGLEGEAGAALAETARELAEATRAPWRVRATKRSVAAAGARGLDRVAGIVVGAPASIDDVDTLDEHASHVRHGVAATLALIQGALVAQSAVTDGVGAPPALAIDAAVAQVAAVLTGLAEWYLVASYAVCLMQRQGIEAEPLYLRRIVNAALLSRHDDLDPQYLEPGVEGRLILRWVARGVAGAIPLLSGYPTQRVRKAGRRLQNADLAAMVASVKERPDT
jgi:hypothetical protein